MAAYRRGEMTVLPETVYVTRKQVCQVYGLNWYTLKKAARARLLHPVKLPAHKYAKYFRREVIEVFGNKEGKK